MTSRLKLEARLRRFPPKSAVSQLLSLATELERLTGSKLEFVLVVMVGSGSEQAVIGSVVGFAVGPAEMY